MKTNKKFLFVTVILLVAYVLSACGGVPAVAPAEQAAVKVDASLVAYTGTLEGINGDQWVVNGQTLTVDPAVVRDGPFQVGDTVKVEGNVNPDGSFTVSRIEAPSASDLTELPQLGNDNANANSNDDNTNGNINDNANVNSNDNNSNDDNTNLNSNDDNSNDDNTNINSNDDNSNDDNANTNSNDDNSNDDKKGDSGNDSKDNNGGHNGNDDSSGDDRDDD